MIKGLLAKYEGWHREDAKQQKLLKAIWNGHVVAEAPQQELVHRDGNWYFPPESIDRSFLRPLLSYPFGKKQLHFDVGKAKKWHKDEAWTYPYPVAKSAKAVNRNIHNYVAFGCHCHVEKVET